MCVLSLLMHTLLISVSSTTNFNFDKFSNFDFVDYFGSIQALVYNKQQLCLLKSIMDNYSIVLEKFQVSIYELFQKFSKKFKMFFKNFDCTTLFSDHFGAILMCYYLKRQLNGINKRTKFLDILSIQEKLFQHNFLISFFFFRDHFVNPFSTRNCNISQKVYWIWSLLNGVVILTHASFKHAFHKTSKKAQTEAFWTFVYFESF